MKYQKKAHTPSISIVDNLSTTNDKNFVYKERRKLPRQNCEQIIPHKPSSSAPTTTTSKTNSTPAPINDKSPTLSPTKSPLHTITPENSDDENINPKICNIHTDISEPYHLTFSNDPFSNTIAIPLNIKGNNPHLGLLLKHHDDFGRLQLIDCTPGTPAAKIPRWRSTIKNGFLTKYNGTSVST